MALLAVVAILAALMCTVNAQFPPTPNGVTTVPSRFNNGILLSYKEVRKQGRGGYANAEIGGNSRMLDTNIQLLLCCYHQVQVGDLTVDDSMISVAYFRIRARIFLENRMSLTFSSLEYAKQPMESNRTLATSNCQWAPSQTAKCCRTTQSTHSSGSSNPATTQRILQQVSG